MQVFDVERVGLNHAVGIGRHGDRVAVLVAVAFADELEHDHGRVVVGGDVVVRDPQVVQVVEVDGREQGVMGEPALVLRGEFWFSDEVLILGLFLTRLLLWKYALMMTEKLLMDVVVEKADRSSGC